MVDFSQEGAGYGSITSLGFLPGNHGKEVSLASYHHGQVYCFVNGQGEHKSQIDNGRFVHGDSSMPTHSNKAAFEITMDPYVGYQRCIHHSPFIDIIALPYEPVDITMGPVAQTGTA